VTTPEPSATATDLVLTGSTVIDPRNGSRLEGHDVVVRGDRIVELRPSAATTGSGAPGVVDATGTFVVPGFNDMHAHPLVMKDPAANLRLMLAYGVTGFRQMSGSAALLQRRSAWAATDAPRLLGTPGMILTPLNAGTDAQVVATVREQHELGADFIKAGLVSPPVFFAAQAEAVRLGLPILGHLPNGIDVLRASGQGMRSIEHLGPGVGLLACCSSAYDEVQGLQLQASLQRKLPSTKLPFMETIFEHVLQRIVLNPVNMAKQADVDVLEHASSTFDQDAALALAAHLAADGTWQVPTLIRSKTNYTCDDPSLPRSDDLRFMAPGVLTSWTKATKKFAKFPDASRQTFRATYGVLLQLTKLLDGAGVKMLAGSDACGSAWEVPGSSLHQEFDELARAGLTPLRVLQLTTSEPAEFLGATADMGSVSEGKLADLVLLDADPLESVANLHGIAGVVRAGCYYDRARLDSISAALASSHAVR
jgi:imidazolonepropionase-like amidohydrolase